MSVLSTSKTDRVLFYQLYGLELLTSGCYQSSDDWKSAEIGNQSIKQEIIGQIKKEFEMITKEAFKVGDILATDGVDTQR